MQKRVLVTLESEKGFTVTASDENLDIDFPLNNGKPAVVSAIEVLSLENGSETTEDVSGQLTIVHSGTNGPVVLDMSGTTNLEGFSHSPPTASFIYTAADLVVEFNDTSTDVDDEIVSWSWNFGDGNTSTIKHPYNSYVAAGDYEVTLTVTDQIGLSGSTTQTITVEESIPQERIVSLPTLQKTIGTSGLIPITATDLTGERFNSYEFKMTYDTAVLDITGIDTTSTMTNSGIVLVNLATPGEVSVSWASIEDLSGSGVLINLEASYLAPGTSPLMFTTFQFNEGGHSVTKVDGSVEVTEASGTGAFLEAGGMVVMEAEHAAMNIPRNDQAWEEAVDNPGFSGASYMASTPDVGEVYNTSELGISPELQFEVNFTTTGLYNFWANMTSMNTKSNTIHIGVNGVMQADGSTLSATTDGSWTWQTDSNRNGVHNQFEILEPGVHTINVWVREDGVLFDKILLTTDAGFTPTGDGPAESPRDTAAPLSQNTPFDADLAKGGGEIVPTEFALNGNYPNPFNPTTTIQFDVSESSSVRMEVFDMMGRRVATLVDATYSAGRYEVQWNATNDAGERVASGIYIYRMQAGEFEAVSKMILMK